MKKISLIGCILFLFALSSKAQLTLEAFAITGTNMLTSQKDYHPDSPLWTFSTYKQLNGINAGGNLGARLFIFNKKWSIGLSLGYLFRYHVSQSPISASRNNEHKHDFLVLPADFAYHFKCGLGIHLGLEASWFINPAKSHMYLDIRKDGIISPLAGISYTYKRFRFDLLYKHSIQNLFVAKYPVRINGVPGVHIDKILHRYHDIELRVAFRIFQFKKIRL